MAMNRIVREVAPLVLVMLIACSAREAPSARLSSFRLRPGEKRPTDASDVAIIHRGTMCLHGVTDHRVRFMIDVQCSTGIIEGVDTYDAHFRTAEGISTKSTLRHAVNAGGQIAQTDGRCEVRMPSGWIAVRRIKPDSSCAAALNQKIESFEAPYIRLED